MAEHAEQVQPASNAPPAAPSGGAIKVVQQRLRRVYQGLVAALEKATGSRLELKRSVQEKAGFDPTPEQLQLLAEVAKVADPTARDLCLKTLSTHLVTGQVLDEYSAARQLDPTQIHGRLELLPVLAATSRKVEGEFQKQIDSIDRRHRDEARRLLAKLERPEEPLQAAMILGPELERLARAVAQATLAEVAPSIGEDEAGLIREACAAGANVDESLRARVDGVAMRTLIERDLEAWQRQPIPGENDTDALQQRMAAFDVLVRDKAAYRVASQRLNAARARSFAGARVGAEEIRRTQQRLFTAYRALNRVINAGPMHSEPIDTGEGQDQDGQAAARLHQQVLEAERAAAEVDAEKQAKQDLVRDAVSGAESKGEAKPDVPPSQRDLQRERKRRKVLIGIAVTLLPISVAVNGLLYRGGSRGTPVVTPASFEEAMPVSNVIPAVTILQTEVSTWLWDNISNEERLAKVEHMARIAEQEGYTDLHVVDQNQVERARWSRTLGAELLDGPTP